MKIYFYYKVDRGYYESAWRTWKRQGGRFEEHLLRTQHTLYSWRKAFSQLGWQTQFDLRSSFLLPQTISCHLPLTLSACARAALWVTRLDVWLLQKSILRRIQQFQPDIVFIPLGSSIWRSTLQKLKSEGFVLAQWCGLPANTMLKRDRANLPLFDITFQPANLEEGLRHAGAGGRIEYVPIGIDPDIHRPVVLTVEEQERYGADVCFIGGLSKQFHAERRAMIEFAIEQGVNIKIWGGYREHFIGSPILKVWQGQIWGEEQVKALCAAKIGLNFHVDHRTGELRQGLNLRAFELAACGVFQLLHRVPGVGEFFEEDKEIVCFDTKEEMLDKICYYLNHEAQRQQIAAAARARVLRDHTWLQRVKLISRVLVEELDRRQL